MRADGYLRIAGGDVNGFLGLVVDNLSVLALLATLLIGGFGIPAPIVFGRMFPGTALGVLIGDLIYTWLAVRLARRTGRADVTAMPFGLDTPSSIGMALLVLGPAYAKWRAAGLDPFAAGLQTWYLGMAATATMGVVKLALAFAGRGVQRLIPRAGLLGSLAGIALDAHRISAPRRAAEDAGSRIPRARSRAVCAHRQGQDSRPHAGRAVRRPRRYAGVLRLRLAGVAGMAVESPALPALRLAFPHPDIGILQGFMGVVDYLPLILPFAC